MNITGPKFEIGQIVKPTDKTPKSSAYFKMKNSLEPSAKIVNIKVVKRFPEYLPDTEYIYMLEFENGAKMSSSWFESIENEG